MNQALQDGIYQKLTETSEEGLLMFNKRSELLDMDESATLTIVVKVTRINASLFDVESAAKTQVKKDADKTEPRRMKVDLNQPDLPKV